MQALVDAIPALSREGTLPWVPLGQWPTPVEHLPALDVHVKRDDLSAVAYGGNKVRTLEALFGEARAAGKTRVWATGAFGSNHAVATVLHARAAGLDAGAMLFPQPPSACARENLCATLGSGAEVEALWSWASVPWAIGRRRRRDPRGYVMVPGGATPVGALGYAAAAFELCAQVERGEVPAPARIVLGVGSTCTSAGLLAGLAAAARLGRVFGAGRPVPEVWAVRVTPWPVTAAFRIVSLAARASALLARLAGDERLAAPRGELAARLRVVGGHIGRGYGYETAGGLDAIERFRAAGGPPLDTCYSAKAAAGMLAARAAREGPTLFWATKSSRPLPGATAEKLAAAPARMRRWLDQ